MTGRCHGQTACQDIRSLYSFLQTIVAIAAAQGIIALAADRIFTNPRVGRTEDYVTGKLVLEVIERVNQELGTTAIVITHNAAIAGMADRVLYLGGGRIQRIEQNAHKCKPSELSW